MPYIPQEILNQIIRYATANEPEDRRKFFNCASFVSHTFHQIVLPYKFRSLTFNFNYIRNHRPSHMSPALPIPSPIPEFCEAINAGDAHALSLAPLVQELSLLNWTQNIFSYYVISESFEKIINSVPSFRNLTKLTMKVCGTSPVIMEQLGRLVQLQSLHISNCHDLYRKYADKPEVSYGALSNLQSLHTLECEEEWNYFKDHLACIPKKNLRILKGNDSKVIEALLTTDPPVQLKELWLNPSRVYRGDDSRPMLWNYLARVTSLTHLSLPHLDSIPPSFIFSFPELQYLHIHIALAPRFADQPMKEMEIKTESEPGRAMIEVRRHWQGTVFPHVEYLKTDRSYFDELEEIPIEFWREFLLNVKRVR